MSDSASRTNGRGLLLAYDDSDIIFGPIHISIQDAVFSPERASARCDEFQEWAELVPALQDDSRSIAEKVRKAIVHLLPRLAGDAQALGFDYRPIQRFQDHITSCAPSEWDGWQFLAAMKTVAAIKAKAGKKNDTHATILQAMKELGAVDRERRKSGREIVKRAFGNAAKPNTYKHAFSDLVRRTVIESLLGNKGGYWLKS